jgi:hypothetical protein
LPMEFCLEVEITCLNMPTQHQASFRPRLFEGA